MTALATSFRPRDEPAPLVEQTVGALLVQRAAEFGDRDAIIGVAHDGTPTRLTYSQLLDEARRVATALAAITEPGDFVALWAPNIIEWPIVQYGAALAGVVLVALNPVLRESELEYALTHSGSRVLIHADRSRAYEMAPVAVTVTPRCDALQHVIGLVDRPAWRAESASNPASREPSDPDDAVMLQYTSGTTGRPKGVLLRHRSLVNVSKLTLEAAGVAPGATAINPLPMFHTAGCVISTLGPLWIGGTVALIEKFEPDPVLAVMRAENADVLFYVPTVLGALIAAQRASSEPAPQLHTVMGGASNVPASMIEAAGELFGATVINLFGQTELAPVLSATRPTDSRADQLETVGRPLPHVDCAILDPDTGEVAPLGVPGEICAHGFQQMIGYLADPEATAQTVDADGWLHTGDLGSMDERGYLRVTGRIKDLVIRGGENIAPLEIEECLAEHPDVESAAVFGVPDDHFGEVLAVALLSGRTPDTAFHDDLVAHCRASLAPHKVPAHWYAIDELPVTPTGKVQKFRLQELVGQPRMTQIS